MASGKGNLEIMKGFAMTKKFTLKWMDWLMILIFAGALAMLITSCSMVSESQKQQVKDEIAKAVNNPEYIKQAQNKINEVLK